MAFWSALRRRADEEDLYEEQEGTYAYEDEVDSGWETPGVQPIRSAADMQIVTLEPTKYEDASSIADHLRDMKFVVLNLARADMAVARRLLDFVSGVAYAEDGHIMKVAEQVYVAAPYFVDLLSETDDTRFF